MFQFETLQNYKVAQKKSRANFVIEMVSSGILRFSLAKRTRSSLTSLQPIRIRAANAFAALEPSHSSFGPQDMERYRRQKYKSGADDQEHATLILSQCHGIFTD